MAAPKKRRIYFCEFAKKKTIELGIISTYKCGKILTYITVKSICIHLSIKYIMQHKNTYIVQQITSVSILLAFKVYGIVSTHLFS